MVGFLLCVSYATVYSVGNEEQAVGYGAFCNVMYCVLPLHLKTFNTAVSISLFLCFFLCHCVSAFSHEEI